MSFSLFVFIWTLSVVVVPSPPPLGVAPLSPLPPSRHSPPPHSPGFMRGSKYAKDVTSFINIESTGPWGPDMLFQYGGWTLDAYASSAPRPRGNSVAMDFFELGVIPADTDFRVLGGDGGGVPGIDVAFLFDGLAYHTKEDTWDRIRPGTLQGMGDNVLAASIEFMRSGGKRGSIPYSSKNAFADIGGRFMVVVPWSLARVLHVAPLAFYIAQRVAIARSPSPGEPLPSGESLYGVLLALLLPSLLGASRAFVSGLPLSWYGSVAEACAIYVPAALAGFLMPITADTDEQAERAVQSSGLIFSVVAFAFTAAGMTCSYVSASWACATALRGLLLGGGSNAWGRSNAMRALSIPVSIQVSQSSRHNHDAHHHALVVVARSFSRSPRISAVRRCFPVCVPPPSPPLTPSLLLPPAAVVAVTTMFHVVEKIGVAGGADGQLGKLVADAVGGY